MLLLFFSFSRNKLKLCLFLVVCVAFVSDSVPEEFLRTFYVLRSTFLFLVPTVLQQ